MLTFSHDNRALDAVFQLADVSGPAIIFGRPQGIFGQADVCTIILSRETADERVGEKGRITLSGTQRGNGNNDLGQSIV